MILISVCRICNKYLVTLKKANEEEKARKTVYEKKGMVCSGACYVQGRGSSDGVI